MWSAILSAPAPPKVEAAPRPKGSTWDGLLPDTRPTERGHQTTRAGRYVARIGAQLQCEPSHDFQIVSSVKLKVAVQALCKMPLGADLPNLEMRESASSSRRLPAWVCSLGKLCKS